MADATERWLPAVGYEGLYEVSDLGKVQSLDRTFWRRNGRIFHLRGRILSQTIGGHGYWQVSLWRDGRHYVRTVHSLVAEAFLGPLPEGQETRHGPAGHLVNAVTNLCYGTPAENHEDMVRDGTIQLGEDNPSAKMTEEAVRQCRIRYAAGGVTYTVLASEFGITRHAMSKAVRRKTWGHVDA